MLPIWLGFEQNKKLKRIVCVALGSLSNFKGSQRKNDSQTGKNSTCSHPNYVSLSVWKQLMHGFPWEYFLPEQNTHLKPLPEFVLFIVCILCCPVTSTEPGTAWALLRRRLQSYSQFLGKLKVNNVRKALLSPGLEKPWKRSPVKRSLLRSRNNGNWICLKRYAKDLGIPNKAMPYKNRFTRCLQ